MDFYPPSFFVSPEMILPSLAWLKRSNAGTECSLLCPWGRIAPEPVPAGLHYSCYYFLDEHQKVIVMLADRCHLWVDAWRFNGAMEGIVAEQGGVSG